MIYFLGLIYFFHSNADQTSYPSGILNQVVNETSKPISDLYVFRENTSITYHAFPVPPDCSTVIDVDDQQIPATITIWKLDQDSRVEWGLLIWKEEIQTLCSWEFWGTYKGSVSSRSSIPLHEIPSKESIEKYWFIEENEIIVLDDVPYNLRFYCYWCRNEYPGKYQMTFLKKVTIIRYPDGTLKSPSGSWVFRNPGFLRDDTRFYYLSIQLVTQRNVSLKYMIFELEYCLVLLKVI